MPSVHLIQHQALQLSKSFLLASVVTMQLVSFAIQMTLVSVKDARLGSMCTIINVRALVQEAGKKTRIAQRASCLRSMIWVLSRSHS